MKSPIRFVRKAIIDALTNNVTDENGANVPVYGRVPSETTYPFISVYNESANEIDENRDSFNTIVSIKVDVVTRFNVNQGGSLRADTISDNVAQLIRTRSSGYPDITSNNFRIYTVTLDNMVTIFDEETDHTYIRDILTFNIRVQEI